MKTKNVDVICLTETNIDWNTPQLVNQFQRTVQKTWSKQKIELCTSTSDLQWASDHKPGRTAMALLNNISSALIQKSKDPSGMGRWTYATTLGRNNKKITVFNVYRPSKMKVEDTGSSTVIKQQWIMMQPQGRDEHLHNATLNDLIKAIQQQQQTQPRNYTYYRWKRTFHLINGWDGNTLSHMQTS